MAKAEGGDGRGTVYLSEVSGACQLPGDRLLLVSDEFGIFLADDADKQVASGHLKPQPKPLKLFTQSELLSFEATTTEKGKSPGRPEEKTQAREQPVRELGLKDCEDVCYDPKNHFAYLITSHARNRRGKLQKERNQIVRLAIHPKDGSIVEARTSDGLFWSILSGLPDVAPALLLPPARGGLNIEGLAWDKKNKHLIAGLRSPTSTVTGKRASRMQEDAIVLRVANVDEMFESISCPAELVPDKETGRCYSTIHLNGHGIRGLTSDEEHGGFWVLSGLSVDPNHEVKNVWGLWHWDGKKTPREVKLPKIAKHLRTPEAVCMVTFNRESYLLVIEDRETDAGLLTSGETLDVEKLAENEEGCPYLLLPTRKLSYT